MAQRVLVTDESYDNAIASILDYVSSEEEEEEEGKSDEELEDSSNILCEGSCSNRYPPESIVRCEAGHPFCLNDSKQYAQSQLGKGIPVLKCMGPSCEKIFPGTEVLRFIDLKIFAGFPKERLQIMIARVGVADLVEICPYCVTVVACGTIQEMAVVQCTNPECKKSSCRKCKRRSHGNKTCEEAHKESNECGHFLRDYPPEEITRCKNGHPFCLEAAKEYAQGLLKKDVLVLKCLDTACDKIFPGKEVLRFIDLKVFSGLPKEKLEIIISKIGVTDLVAICPYCMTVVVCGPIGEGNVVDCTNPECKKLSCRKCQKEVHGVISCEEYERGKKDISPSWDDPRDTVRIAIEGWITDAIKRETALFEIEKMLTDAIMKECNICKTQLLKRNCCNKLICGRCGNTQCYLCSENITDGHHFGKVNANSVICQVFDNDAQPQDKVQKAPGRAPEETQGKELEIQKEPIQTQPAIPKLPPIQTEQIAPVDIDEDSDIPSPGDWM